MPVIDHQRVARVRVRVEPLRQQHVRADVDVGAQNFDSSSLRMRSWRTYFVSFGGVISGICWSSVSGTIVRPFHVTQRGVL